MIAPYAMAAGALAAGFLLALVGLHLAAVVSPRDAGDGAVAEATDADRGGERLPPGAPSSVPSRKTERLGSNPGARTTAH